MLFHPNVLRNVLTPVEHIIKRHKAVAKIIVKRTITQDEVDRFTQLTGDTNPIHSRDYPADKRCVHGAFLNGIVAGIIGTQLPGSGSVLLHQEFGCPQKCVCDEEITITVQQMDDRHIKRLNYEVKQFGMAVFTGTAKIIVKKHAQDNNITQA